MTSYPQWVEHDLYQVLDVGPQASNEEIRRDYRRLGRRLPPPPVREAELEAEVSMSLDEALAGTTTKVGVPTEEPCPAAVMPGLIPLAPPGPALPVVAGARCQSRSGALVPPVTATGRAPRRPLRPAAATVLERSAANSLSGSLRAFTTGSASGRWAEERQGLAVVAWVIRW